MDEYARECLAVDLVEAIRSKHVIEVLSCMVRFPSEVFRWFPKLFEVHVVTAGPVLFQ